MRGLIKYALMFICLVLIQVVILNQVQFSGYVNPYIYFLFILLLPLSLPRYAMLLLAFLLGITIDVFSNSLGMHAAATVFIAYMRPGVVGLISSREEDRSDYPGLAQTNFRWFLSYTSIMVFLHHFVLFYLEVLSFSHFFETFFRIIISSLFSIFIIVLSQYIFFRK
jgi:hypothetical protein